jgi:hypothetical protein
MNDKVIIICRTHGEFEQMPSNHITHKQGCGYCGGHYLSNTIDFIEKALKIHRDKYDYSLVEYINNLSNIKIICRIHGNFEQTPSSHLRGSGCYKCGRLQLCEKQRTPVENFIYKATDRHENKYNYSLVHYINARTYITIICPQHGEFIQTPDSHLRGNGCFKCSHNMTIFTKEQFIEKAHKVHGDKYDYSNVIFTKMNDKVIIICRTHHEYEQTPNNHIYGNGCKKCISNHSKSQIKWLNFMSGLYCNEIQHAENGGEYKIPSSRYTVDGYCQKTNTIYEFHGDFWHGNPKKYKSYDLNPCSIKTYGELYNKTIEREQYIKDNGYNLVVIWESEWIMLNKSIRIIQSIFRNFK